MGIFFDRYRVENFIIYILTEFLLSGFLANKTLAVFKKNWVW